jgi:hypothetical protein
VSGLAPPRGRTRLFFDLAILAASLTATGQEKPGSELFRTITELDAELFDAYRAYIPAKFFSRWKGKT